MLSNYEDFRHDCDAPLEDEFVGKAAIPYGDGHGTGGGDGFGDGWGFGDGDGTDCGGAIDCIGATGMTLRAITINLLVRTT